MVGCTDKQVKINLDDDNAKELITTRIAELKEQIDDGHDNIRDNLFNICELDKLQKQLKNIEYIDNLNLAELEFDEGTITTKEDYIQLYFYNCPHKIILDLLKQYGFKWDKWCWKIKNTRTGIYNLCRFLKDYKHYKKQYGIR